MIAIHCLAATWSFWNMSGHSHTWAVVFICRHSFSYVGSHLGMWVVIGQRHGGLLLFFIHVMSCVVVIVCCLLGVAMWVVGIVVGHWCGTWDPVSVKETEWDGEVSTYYVQWQCQTLSLSDNATCLLTCHIIVVTSCPPSLAGNSWCDVVASILACWGVKWQLWAVVGGGSNWWGWWQGGVGWLCWTVVVGREIFWIIDCWCRKFPLAEFADILSKKEVYTVGI